MFETILNIALIIAMIATAITLVTGVGTFMGMKGKERREASNRMMQMRIFFQTVALIILSLLFFMGR